MHGRKEDIWFFEPATCGLSYLRLVAVLNAGKHCSCYRIRKVSEASRVV
jgi:hypothetical protein